jgi:hypothetical protein
MQAAGIETSIPAGKRVKTLALNRKATGIGNFHEEMFRMKHIRAEEICTVRRNMYSRKECVQ